MRRSFTMGISLAVLCLFAAGLAGAAGTRDAAAGTALDKPITITVAPWPSKENADLRNAFDQYAARLTAKYPAVTIQGDEWIYSADTFLPRAASGTLPTLYQTFFTETRKIMSAGYAQDLTEPMKRLGYTTAINPKVLELCTTGGKYYFVPSNGYTIGLYQNVAVFREAGLVDAKGYPLQPATYQQMAQYAQTIKEKTGKAGFLFPAKDNHGGWAFMSVAWSFGAEFEKLVDGKWRATFNSPEGVAALQFVKDLRWKYNCLTDNVMYNILEAMEPFGTYKVGMTVGNLDLANFPVDTYKFNKDDFAMAPMPAGPRGAYTLLGGAVWAVAPNSSPAKIEAAFEFIEAYGNSPKVDDESLSGLENSLKAMQGAGLVVGPSMSLIFTAGERATKETALNLKYKTVNMDLWNDYLRSPTTLRIHEEEPQNAQELYAALDTVIQAVLTDRDADPKALLDKVAGEFQKTYLDKIK